MDLKDRVLDLTEEMNLLQSSIEQVVNEEHGTKEKIKEMITSLSGQVEEKSQLLEDKDSQIGQLIALGEQMKLEIR